MTVTSAGHRGDATADLAWACGAAAEQRATEAAMPSGEAGFLVLVGHPRPGSRTHAVALRAAGRLGRALSAGGLNVSAPIVVDLAELGPCLLDRNRNGTAEAALSAVQRVPLLLPASPTFRGACSGLIKLFLDLLPRNGLESTVAVPLMTAGIPAHRHAVDESLRPVLIELRARVPVTGISVLETELASFDAVFDAWWSSHGRALTRAMTWRLARPRDQVSC